MRKRPTSLSTWLSYCREYDQTDLSQLEFCQNKGISYKRFNHYFVNVYQDRKGEQQEERKTGFIEVNLPVEKPFKDYRLLESGPEIRVSFPNGMVIHFPKELSFQQFIAFTIEVAGL